MSEATLWNDAVLRVKKAGVFGFLLGMRVRTNGPSYCDWHRHEGLEIVYHRRGKGITRTDSGTLEYQEGSIVIYGPRRQHDQTSPGEIDDLCVHLKLPFSIGAKLTYPLYLPEVRDSRITSEIESLAMRPAPDRDLEQRILSLRGTAVLLDLVSISHEMSSETMTSTADLLARRAERFLHENFANISSVNEVARHVGVSPDYLRHVFKSRQGRSLVGYLNDVRIAQAKALLAHSPMPLKQVATACGFKDEYYFSAVFRKLCMTSPGAYRTEQKTELA